MSGQRGATLLEVVVATLLLGVAAVGMLGTVHQALAGIHAARQHSQAVMRASSALTELLALPRLQAGQALPGAAGAAAGWSAVTERWQPGDPRLGSPELVKVRVEAWWLSGGERKTLALQGYRRAEAP